jgi:hypothetical protein
MRAKKKTTASIIFNLYKRDSITTTRYNPLWFLHMNKMHVKLNETLC